MELYTRKLPINKRLPAAGEIHIWQVSLDEPANRYSRLLSESEQQAAARFHYEKDRQRYIVSHGIVRSVLGGYLGVDPVDIAYSLGEHGKPDLAGRNVGGLRFNVSHSRDEALIAISSDVEIGVDIEYMRDIPEMDNIVERFCAEREKASFRALTDDIKKIAFYACWTRKEAFIKATGEGLSRPLNSFAVSLVPGVSGQLLELDGSPGDLSGWTVDDVPCHQDFTASFAYRGMKPAVIVFNWQTETSDSSHPDRKLTRSLG